MSARAPLPLLKHWKPLICVGISLSAVAAVMTYTLVMKSIAGQRFGDDDGERSEQSTSNIAFLDKKPRIGLIAAEEPAATIKPNAALDSAKLKEIQVPPLAPNNAAALNPYEQAEFQLWQCEKPFRSYSLNCVRGELGCGASPALAIPNPTPTPGTPAPLSMLVLRHGNARH